MSFLNALVTNPVRAEELRHAWKTLSYDIITQPLPASPPPTPNVIDFQSANPSGSVRHLSSDFFFERPQCQACMDPGNNRSCTNQTHYTGDLAKCQNNSEKLYKKQLSYECVSESSNEPMVRKRKIASDTKLCHTKRKRTNIEEIACQVHGILSLPGCREPRYNISRDELRRRVNQPECLTKVDMISYVRLAKNSARLLLQKHDIKTNQHNQRSEHTVLSKMCEEECRTLANGINDINYRYFPGTWFAFKSAQEIINNNMSTSLRNEALIERQKEDEITKFVLLDIYFGLEKRKNDHEMNAFNLVSHSFGLPNLQNHILFLLSYLEEELRILRTA